MKIMKALKVLGFVILGIILITGIFATFYYYQIQGKYQVNSEKYAHNVGYIDSENTIQLGDNFSLCGSGELIGYYHSAAPRIYRGTKSKFRDFILANFENKEYEDSGFLNLRFHINCNGQVGNLEVNELDSDLKKSELTTELVAQIMALISRSENWEPFAVEDYNYYMYLNFKIEDGDISEIIP